MARLVKIAVTSDLPPGKSMAFEVEGRRIALFNVDGEYCAIADTCPHAGASLCEGEVTNGVVTCPWHGADFELRTGQCLGPPADEPIQTFRVFVEGDDIKVEN